VGAHMLDPGRPRPLRARKLLARYGAGLLFDLLDHKEADLSGKGDLPVESLAELRELRAIVEREQESPHRLRDLAIGGDDLIGLGFAPGPEIGGALRALLDEVVVEPELNTRKHLLARAQELGP
jgi:tRNA nucleotidyltransferase (CCA-adding enzyme)